MGVDTLSQPGAAPATPETLDLIQHVEVPDELTPAELDAFARFAERFAALRNGAEEHNTTLSPDTMLQAMRKEFAVDVSGTEPAEDAAVKKVAMEMAEAAHEQMLANIG